MSTTPKIFYEKTAKEIEEWGFLGVSEDVIFNMLGLSEKSRNNIRRLEKWNVNYRKGLARREIELARTLVESKDSQLIKELLKSTSLVDKKIIEDNAVFDIEAPEWMKIKKRKNEIKDRRKRIQSKV